MGGIGTYTRQYALALAHAGHEAHIFTLNIPDDLRPHLPQHPNLHFHETPDLATRIAGGTLAPQSAAALNAGGEGMYRLAIGQLLCAHLLQVHQETPFDIVETPEVEALGLPLMLNPNFHIPIITHLHCCTAIAFHGNQMPLTPAENLITNLELAAIHLADRVCAPTKAVVNATELFTPIPPPPFPYTPATADYRHARLIPHAYVCDDAPFMPPPLPPAPPIMLFIGRIERLKGVIAIAEALNMVLPAHPQAIFRFLGPDTSSAPPVSSPSAASNAPPSSMRQYLRALLKPEIATRVEFLGEVSQTQITQELQNCAFCVQPSFWENFSMTCCEAFAAGRTVIVGQETGSAELVGPAGLIINPHSSADLAQAMHRLLTDQPLLHRLSHLAYTRIRTAFSPAAIIPQYETFYLQTVQEYHRTPRMSLADRLRMLPPDLFYPLLPTLVQMLPLLTGTPATASTPGTRLLRILNQHSQQTGNPPKVLLYGAGKFTTRLLTERHLWENSLRPETGPRIIGLIDDHPRFQTQPTYLDLPVQSLAAANAALTPGPDAPIIILSTDTYQDQFWQQTAPLRAKGICVYKLYEEAGFTGIARPT